MEEQNTQPENISDVTKVSPEPKEKIAKFLWVLSIIIVILSLVIFYAYMYKSQGVKEIIEQHKQEDEKVNIETRSDSVYGEMLTTREGRTLYFDPNGFCEDYCGLVFQKLLSDVEVSEGNIATVLDEYSGKYQYTWDGKKLYTYMGDQVPGDARGLEAENALELAHP